MPIPFNLAASLLLGTLLPVLLRRSPALLRSFANWILLALALFLALVFTPVCTYWVRFFPHWSLMYAFDPQIFPRVERGMGVLSGAVVLLHFGIAVLGYAVSRRAILARRAGWALLPLALALGVWVTGLTLWYPRVVAVGDFDRFWQGQATTLYKHPAGIVGGLLYSACLLFVVLLRRRFGRRDPTLL